MSEKEVTKEDRVCRRADGAIFCYTPQIALREDMRSGNLIRYADGSSDFVPDGTQVVPVEPPEMPNLPAANEPNPEEAKTLPPLVAPELAQAPAPVATAPAPPPAPVPAAAPVPVTAPAPAPTPEAPVLKTVTNPPDVNPAPEGGENPAPEGGEGQSAPSSDIL